MLNMRIDEEFQTYSIRDEKKSVSKSSDYYCKQNEILSNNYFCYHLRIKK